jgi:hypothetical protein
VVAQIKIIGITGTGGGLRQVAREHHQFLGIRHGCERSRMASASVKIAVAEPIPSARELTAIAVSRGLCRRIRSA